MFKTTEITAYDIPSDNVIHQRLFFAYEQSVRYMRGHMLEVGCGVGKGLELFKDACTHYTAIDKNTALINHLSAKYPSYRFIDAFIPPFKGLEDNSFDSVVTQQVIEHIEDDHLFLKEIKRVLKPGGCAVITTPNLKLSLTRNPWHVREYTTEQFRDILGKYFSKVQLWGVTGSPAVMAYYEQNKASVQRITRFDILNLQYRLPRTLLQIPYDFLNRRNRKKLQQQSTGLVSTVTTADYWLTETPETAFDFFAVVEK
ncbi:MAG: class I SAM-dependent methyltransferase [Cytophagales bacterium]|nr:MAG: class I SAM-dependent methyltransferase [Cytophagales bacterium]TAF61397.1 MAG: class I SAM-dependent methyltransferase [Cytophagales bacterium]